MGMIDIKRIYIVHTGVLVGIVILTSLILSVLGIGIFTALGFIGINAMIVTLVIMLFKLKTVTKQLKPLKKYLFFVFPVLTLAALLFIIITYSVIMMTGLSFFWS